MYGEETLSRTHVMNGINGFPKEGTKLSLTADLDVTTSKPVDNVGKVRIPVRNN